MEWLSNTSVERVLAIIIGVVAVLVITGLIKRTLNRTVKDIDTKYRVRKATNLLGYLLMVILILFVYSDRLGNIGIALGMAGAGVAFALQEIIVSIAGWISIMINQSVKGDIIDIGVLTTTIMEIRDWVNGDLYNGRIVSVGNSFVFKQTLHNYSARYPFLWDECKVPLRLESDHVLAEQVFTQILNDITGDFATKSEANWLKLANEYRVETAQVAPMVTLTFNESWITFTLRYIVDYKKRRTTKSLIYTRILNELPKHPSLKVAAATLEVTTISGDE